VAAAEADAIPPMMKGFAMLTVDQIRHGSTSRSVRMTCAVDGCDHLVSGQATEAGLAAGQGHYRAVCGHLVVAAALVVPPGPTCRDCETTRHRRTVAGATSHRRRGLVVRLVRRGIARVGLWSMTVGSHRAVRG